MLFELKCVKQGFEKHILQANSQKVFLKSLMQYTVIFIFNNYLKDSNVDIVTITILKDTITLVT